MSSEREPPETTSDIEEDVIIGTAVETLLEEGDEQAAALVLDVLSFRIIYHDTAFSMNTEEAWDLVDVVLLVPRWLESRFTDDVVDRIWKAMQPPAYSQGIHIMEVRTETPLAEPGWRRRAEERLGQGPSNQGTVGQAPRQWITRDRMRFRDAGELAVYDAFKRAQQLLPKDLSLTILPNPAARTRTGLTWEPDFFIAYRGRAGVVEVDGASHHGRAAADKSRDRFFEDSGIAYIDRWLVEDTNDVDALDELVSRFLRKLAGS